MSSGYALTVRFTMRDATAARQFDELVAQTAVGIRTEPGTLVYVVHTPVSEPLVRVFYELYADQDAFQAHEEQAHTKRFLAARGQFLASTEVTVLNELGDLSKRPEAAG
ncbi:putative quinol monooxygenase [Streptomyces botrytidirepellens]|uniref:Antibiotic biosynthesis monooxygenase n=1 Tax=Streptomyces botrytidirepellens TaxID=2486417 RepID=A0A3M8W818_9ACTN|nr:antibiotic biosynthesis monooxygenase [Streptomyces botrytidirepellens]RNG26252.1 antibiotic biosynthesis monooxygenase [Streptomyces botrytidirepellens]